MRIRGWLRRWLRGREQGRAAQEAPRPAEIIHFAAPPAGAQAPRGKAAEAAALAASSESAAARNRREVAEQHALVEEVFDRALSIIPGAGQVYGAYKLAQQAGAAAEAFVREEGGVKARQDSARVLPTLAAGQALQKLAPGAAAEAAKALENLGGPFAALGGSINAAIETTEGKRALERYAFATGVAGPVGLAGAVVGDAASALIGAVAGKEAEKAVRNFVREFDPTATGTFGAQVADAAAFVVRSLPFAPKAAAVVEAPNIVEDPRAVARTAPAAPLTAAQLAEAAAVKKEAAAELGKTTGRRAPIRKELL